VVLEQTQEVRRTSGSQGYRYVLGYRRWSVIVNSEKNCVPSLMKQIKLGIN